VGVVVGNRLAKEEGRGDVYAHPQDAWRAALDPVAVDLEVLETAEVGRWSQVRMGGVCRGENSQGLIRAKNGRGKDMCEWGFGT
jgi:hypothetical protein